MQYVHLMRNGLDMAYSGNQVQANNWSKAVGVELTRDKGGRITPGSVLDYWLTANEVALQSCDRHLAGRAYTLRFEQLCAAPAAELAKLMEFLALDIPTGELDAMAALVAPPASIGRYLQANWREDFSAGQLDRLDRLGYQP